ncbi:hypothetical protein [Flavisolibacter tropicus]|uniref:Uncharacterized protein n=1 Tax=Flavisolibacter tropicus TaxID=1492898 RepID=A0A172TQU1_9BACT|nr:hypothetical protein [Flavisolibacter tropicus]ANE49352.1 hypothetical protein SY85_01380 [Flavisolibacter tropicus]
MRPVAALEGGLAGAFALTAVHQLVKRAIPQAPRLDLLGMAALSKLLKSVGKNPPREQSLYYITMAGDIVSNSLYYSLAGVGKKKNSLLRGSVLGLAAGLGAIFLPEPLGLNASYSKRTVPTQIMTIAWYTLGGFVSALIMKKLESRREAKDDGMVEKAALH